MIEGAVKPCNTVTPLGNRVTHLLTPVNKETPVDLGDRTAAVIKRYWGGSVNEAAVDLGVRQQSLHRVQAGVTTSPQAWFFDAMARGLDISEAWLARGEGAGPTDTDAHGRPLIAGVPSWRRAVSGLQLPPETAEALLDLPFRPWRAALALAGGANAPKRATVGLHGSLAGSLYSWAQYFEQLRQSVEAEEILRAATENISGFKTGFPGP